MRVSDVLNQAALMDRIDHDIEFLADAAELYNKDRSKLISQMRKALSKHDTGALANAAHTLSGLACSFSAQPVVYAALKLEQLAEKDELHGAEEALAALEDETNRLQTALQAILHQRRKTDVHKRHERNRLTTAKHRIRVITIDDHEITRSGIRFMLLARDDIELVGEALNGVDALRLCKERKPDVVLMDLKMPKMNGVEATRTIRREHPNTQVLVLTSYHGNALVKDAMKAGAIGYVMKDVSKEELAKAICEARAGRTVLSPEAATDLLAQGPLPRNVTTWQREPFAH